MQNFLKKIFPQKTDKKPDIIKKIILIFIIIAIIACLIIGLVLIINKVSQKKLIPVESSSTIPSSVPSSEPSSIKPTNMPDGYLPEFEELYNTNKEVKAKLIIPNTKIDYPVVQKEGSIGNSFYLNHNFEQKYSDWGNLFIDYRVDLTKEKTSKNIMMYGHGDDARGLQLSNMKKYRDVNFYKENPVITFDTVYEKAQWKIITMFKENVGKNNCFEYWNSLELPTDDTFNSYIENVKRLAFFSPVVDVNPTDQLLSIQVCETSNTSNMNRLVLVARKVRPNENISVDTAQAKQLK